MGHTGTIVRDATVKAMTLTRKIVSILQRAVVDVVVSVVTY